jgi:hypothetical protein
LVFALIGGCAVAIESLWLLYIVGLEVTDKFIIVQYYIEPGIDVYDRETKQFLFRSGQTLKRDEI